MSAGGAEREARELAELIKAGHISSFDDSIEAVLQFADRCANEARLEEHAKSCVYCNQGDFSGCDRGRALKAAQHGEKELRKGK